MVSMTCNMVLGLLLAAAAATAAGADDPGSLFTTPPAVSRPRFRYWVPDGNASPSVVRRDVEAAARIGAGGIEFLEFFEYGGGLVPPPAGANWSTGAFGNEASNRAFREALRAHQQTAMTMDFALGGNQGQGVPASPDDEGLQWDLVPYMADVAFDEPFDGPVPGWGNHPNNKARLVAVVSAVVLSQANTTFVPPPSLFAPGDNATYQTLVLEDASLRDLSGRLSGDGGQLQATFPRPPNGDHIKLFAFYQVQTAHKNVVFPSNISASIFDNGSYAVDHFSRRGAQTVVDFWETHILADPEIRDLVRSSGHTGWEDSIELASTINWSPSLPPRFAARFGYDLHRYLPLIIFGNNNIMNHVAYPGIAHCQTDAPDGGQSRVNDFRIILADAYNEYLDTLAAWLHSLGVRLRVQPTYNLPMDMRLSIPHVDVPECEGLGFENNIDSYRQFSGAAVMAGRNVVSNEIGADQMRAFSFTIPDLVREMSKGFVGGVNSFVIHGQSYTGSYPNTTWPGHVAFGFLHAELWSPRRPDWEHGLAQAMAYIGRVQHVQQSGVAKVDIAVYDKQTYVVPTEHAWNTTDQADVVKQGWSYYYISPENFNLPGANVSNNVLSPAGPAFQAVVVPSYENFTLEALESLHGYAQSGLPVILIGGQQGYYPSSGGGHEEAVSASFAAFKTTKNVHVVQEGQLTSALRSLGLQPRVAVDASAATSTTWYSTWREDAASGISYAYIFNDGNATTTGAVKVQSSAQPYLFDAWTGERKPVLTYTADKGITTIPLTLAASQSVIIAFSDRPLAGARIPTGAVHAVSAPDNILGYDMTEDGSQTFVHAAASQQQQGAKLVLSSGASVEIPCADVPAAFALDSWTLTAELWEAPADLNDAASLGTRRNVTHQLDSSSLPSWTEIPGLANSSGVGNYSTNFSMPSWASSSSGVSAQQGGSEGGAYIRLPAALDTFTLIVNSHVLPALDLYDPLVDVTVYLRPAGEENQVTVVVPTTMWNYLRTRFDEFVSAGAPPILEFLHLPTPGPREVGLVGKVEVVPYQMVRVL